MSGFLRSAVKSNSSCTVLPADGWCQTEGAWLTAPVFLVLHQHHARNPQGRAASGEVILFLELIRK